MITNTIYYCCRSFLCYIACSSTPRYSDGRSIHRATCCFSQDITDTDGRSINKVFCNLMYRFRNSGGDSADKCTCKPRPDFAIFIASHNRVIPTVCKHIAGNGITRVCAGIGIRINEAMILRVIIARAQIIEPRFTIISIRGI